MDQQNNQGHETNPTPKAFMLGIDRNDATWTIDDSLAELAELAHTAGLEIAGTLIQKRPTPHYLYYLGSGKIKELAEILTEQQIEVVLIDDELQPIQQKAIEKQLNVKVIDRTGLILDIFAQRAITFEAQLQVEMAQLEYLRPRLSRMWTHLSRLGGGVGTRGPGEKQLEVDRRRINEKITFLKKELLKVGRQRELQKAKRHNIPMFSTTIIGYTNAGKSTLLNALTKAEVLVEDKLFATLDPTTRKLLLPNRTEILLTDTVGFIKKLPHQLVDSFKSTLESARQADLLLHVVDASNPHFISFIDTVEKLLSELKIENKPTLLILNKMDKVQDKIALEASLKKVKHKVYISALNNLDMDSLLAEIERVLQGFRKKVTFKVPYQQMDVLNLIYQNSNVLETIYDEKLTKIKVEINTILAAKIKGMLR